MIQREKGTKITDEFLETFGKLYHAFKFFGISPNEIREVFMKLLNVSRSTYLIYLKRAREKKFIVDSYEENQEELKRRMKGESVQADPEVKALIFSYLKEETKKAKTTRKRKTTKAKTK